MGSVVGVVGGRGGRVPARRQPAGADVVLIDREGAESILVAAMRAHGWTDRAIDVTVAELLDAEWRGVASHGLALLPDLLAWSAQRRRDPVITQRRGATATVDGGDGPGSLVAQIALDEAIDLARTHGVGVVTATNRSPFVRGGYHARQAAERGVVAVVAATAPSRVAPYGGRTPVFGTNPLAAAFPRADGPPVVVDLSMTVLPASEIRRRDGLGIPLPPDAAVDHLGQPTTDPAAALAGAMLPFGGHKGSGLALMIELLVGGLAGGRVGTSHAGDRAMLFLVVDPAERTTLPAVVASLVADLRASGDEVHVPGTSQPDWTAPVEVPDHLLDVLRAAAAPAG
jgi:(2R)-3-sulfolactate dehydrogenase (NADP+)